MRVAEYAPVRGGLFAGVPPDEAFKIAAGNVLSFFRLADTPMGKTVVNLSERRFS